MKKLIFLIACLCAPIQVLQLAQAQQDQSVAQSQQDEEGCDLSQSDLPIKKQELQQTPKPRVKPQLSQAPSLLQPQAQGQKQAKSQSQGQVKGQPQLQPQIKPKTQAQLQVQPQPKTQTQPQIKPQPSKSKPQLQQQNQFPLPQKPYQPAYKKPKKPSAIVNSAQPQIFEPAKTEELKIVDKKRINWSGLYIGARVGSATGKSQMSSSAGCPSDIDLSWICSAESPGSEANLPIIDAAGSGNLTDKSITGGFQLGYDIKKGNIVFGPKIDITRLKLQGSRSVDVYLPHADYGGAPVNIGSNFSTNWMISAQGRVGIVSNNFLFYTNAGLARIDLTVGNSYRDIVGGSESASNKSWKSGFIVGGGVEWSLNNHWSLLAEYSQADFGKTTVNGFIVSSNPGEERTANPLNITSRLKVQIATVGLNYRF